MSWYTTADARRDAEKQRIQGSMVGSCRPLNESEIDRIAPEAQEFFARNFGGAPGDWSNEKVRTSPEFKQALKAIVRAVEQEHGINA